MNILKFSARNLLLICVGVPTIAVGIYSSLLAQKELAATATAIVKENQRSSGPSMPGFASALFDYGNKTSLEDAYLLKAFLESENFIVTMNEELALEQHFKKEGFPFFQRLSSTAEDGEIYKYILDRLAIQLSVDSSIITLQFRSFDPDFSKKVLEYIIDKAEIKINDLAQRMTDSHMTLARDELGRAERELREATKALLTFQTENEWLDESEVVAAFTQIEALRTRLLDSKIQRETLLLSMNPESPRIQNLDSEIQATENTLAALNRNLTENDSDSSVALASKFSALKLELEFAQNKYTASTASFQQAQLEASQQHKFLLLISPAKAESSAVAPNPVEAILTTFVVSLLVFLVLRLVVLTIRDHTV